jgi:hypothetical protein
MQVSSIAMDSGVSLCLFKNISVGFLNECFWGFWFRAVEQYPSEALRTELSVKIGLTDRQLQMWFCHRRLKDRKPPSKRQRWDEEAALSPAMAPSSVLPLPAIPLASSDHMMGTAVPYDEPLHPTYPHRGGRSSAVPRISMPDIGRRYYEPSTVLLPPPVASIQLTPSELRLIHSVESQHGEPLRDDGPVLGIEFDPLPPGAFGAPIGMYTEISSPSPLRFKPMYAQSGLLIELLN